MRVMFVSINKLKSYRPVLPIGMVTVATQVRAAGHPVHCVDLMFEEDDEVVVRREARAFRPDVVGISIRNVDSLNLLEPAIYTPLALEVAEWVRAEHPGVRVVLGGAGFTTVPEDLMDFVDADFGILGFAERSLGELLACMEDGRAPVQVEGAVYREGRRIRRNEPRFEIDYARVLPPDRTLYDPRYFEYTFETHDEVTRVPATIQTKKGCVLECVFCSNFLIDGTGVRSNDARAVADEIERIAAEGMESYEIVDGVFNLPLHHALEILRELDRRDVRLPWSCMINPGAVSPELADLMVRTGCREVELGTDSCSDRVLSVLRKNFRKRRITEVHQLFRNAGIRTMHCLFIGSPGDDGESVMETFDAMDALVPDGSPDSHVYWTFGLRICRGTELYRMAVQERVIRGDERFLVPKYYVSPAVLRDEPLLDRIQERVLANRNWYLWWGLGNISLRERLRMAREESAAIEQQILGILAKRRPGTLPLPVLAV
jgi:radical SAM superfamily enzyme YgiQ (UPF0313 family)